jgi:hypothetical protein
VHIAGCSPESCSYPQHMLPVPPLPARCAWHNHSWMRPRLRQCACWGGKGPPSCRQIGTSVRAATGRAESEAHQLLSAGGRRRRDCSHVWRPCWFWLHCRSPAGAETFMVAGRSRYPARGLVCCCGVQQRNSGSAEPRALLHILLQAEPTVDPLLSSKTKNLQELKHARR